MDEAYIHFSDAPYSDLVAADKDIVVFAPSQLYGMAGARLGLVSVGTTCSRINNIGGFTFCPVPAVCGWMASLNQQSARRINADQRQQAFDWLFAAKGYTFTASRRTASCWTRSTTQEVD